MQLDHSDSEFGSYKTIPHYRPNVTKTEVAKIRNPSNWLYVSVVQHVFDGDKWNFVMAALVIVPGTIVNNWTWTPYLI
jgi:hypothetical protein